MVENVTSGQRDGSSVPAYRVQQLLDNSVVHYEHDQYPSSNTSLSLALRWFSIADSLHKSSKGTEHESSSAN